MSKHEYKTALGRLDKDTRTCFKYLERLITEKFNSAMTSYQPPAPKADLSKIESRLDSLQKQIDGLRPKVDASYDLVQSFDEKEKCLKSLTKRTEEAFDELKQLFEEMYNKGVFKFTYSGKIREEGLLGMRDEKV